jgi:site-specific DNA-methyltransferase (adenine-specific)
MGNPKSGRDDGQSGQDVQPETRMIAGDCLQGMATLPDSSVHCAITSPPYWGLRDYGNAGQIGLEKAAADYVGRMVEVFRAVRRILRDDGTAWVNLGDTYRGGQLAGIPWRVALALQADGWRLRQDVIWAKPSPMPESVRDRCTRAHEYLFILAKSARYFFDAAAIGEPYADGIGRDRLACPKAARGRGSNEGQRMRSQFYARGWRNRRSVWTIATQNYRGAHFAVMPGPLVETCIRAGTPAGGCCAECGAPAVCDCNAARIPCTVFDPFAGSGTTLAVAVANGRSGIGCELNPDYIALAEQRISAARSVSLPARQALPPARTA